MKHTAIILLLGLLACSWASNSLRAENVSGEKVEVDAIHSATMDAIIDQLPDVGNEGKWNKKKTEYVYHPAYHELMRRVAEGEEPTDAQWRRILVDTRAIRVPRRWPADKSFAISMRKPRWLGVCEIRMKPRTEGLKEAKAGTLFDFFQSDCITYGMSMYRAALCQRLGKLPLGKHHLVFNVVVKRGKEDDSFPFLLVEKKKKEELLPSGILWAGNMAFDVEIVDSVDECVPPAESDKLAEAVRHSLGITFSDRYADNTTAIFIIDPDVKDYPILADTALSLKIEVLHQDRVVESRHLMASDDDPFALLMSVSKWDHQAIGCCWLKSVPADLKTRKEDWKDWSVRVSGTSDKAIYLWDAKRRWSGLIEMPIDELIEREKERTKGKDRWGHFPSLR